MEAAGALNVNKIHKLIPMPDIDTHGDMAISYEEL